MCAAACARPGARVHNKFCLLLYFLVELTCTVIILIITSAAILGSQSQVPDESQLFCSTKGYNSTCDSFLADEERTALRELWKYMYKASVSATAESVSFTQTMEDIQTQGRCCGFEPPYACRFGPSSEATLDAFVQSSENVPSMCGTEPFWYNPMENCAISIELETGQLYKPGCPYFLPVGTCVSFEYDRGCIHQLRLYLVDSYVPLFNAVEGLVSVNLMCCFLSCCLLAKRKDHDILPTSYVIAKLPVVKK